MSTLKSTTYLKVLVLSVSVAVGAGWTAHHRTVVHRLVSPAAAFSSGAKAPVNSGLYHVPVPVTAPGGVEILLLVK